MRMCFFILLRICVFCFFFLNVVVYNNDNAVAKTIVDAIATTDIPTAMHTVCCCCVYRN